MATELITKQVDEHSYQFEQFGAKEALKVLMRLSKLTGKPFVLALGAYEGKGKPLNMAAVSEAASLLFQAMDETETLTLFELLTAKKVLCDGKNINFDTHYEGRLTHLFKVLQTALEVQYGNFFSAVSEFLSAGKPTAEALTQAK